MDFEVVSWWMAIIGRRLCRVLVADDILKRMFSVLKKHGLSCGVHHRGSEGSLPLQGVSIPASHDEFCKSTQIKGNLNVHTVICHIHQLAALAGQQYRVWISVLDLFHFRHHLGHGRNSFLMPKRSRVWIPTFLCRVCIFSLWSSLVLLTFQNLQQHWVCVNGCFSCMYQCCLVTNCPTCILILNDC